MRDGWEKVAISDICIMIKRGQTPSYTESKSVTVLNQKCIRDGRINLEFSRQTDANLKPINQWAYLNATDTLVNSTGVGTLGRVAFVKNLPEPTTVDSHVTIVRPDNEKVEPSFLGLTLNFREADIEGLAAGSSGQTELSREALGNLIITLPTLPEQKRFVDLISSVDSYIEALQQKLKGAKRSRNAVLYELLTAGGDDWVEEVLGEISEVTMGRQLSPSKKLGLRPRPYIRAANIGSWGISLEEIFEMDFTEVEEFKFSSKVGDTLLVEGGNEKSVGCPALVSKREEGLCIQNTVIRCRSKNPSKFDPNFQYHLLRFMFWRGDFAELCAGTTIMHLGQKRAEAVKVQLPPKAKQIEIVEIISTMDEVVNKTELTLAGARNLRSGLLSDLLNGDHEIPSSYDKTMSVA